MTRKATSIFWTLLFTAPFLVAMGGGGGAPATDTIPRPEDNFRADLTDRQGVVVAVEHLSCDGKTFLPLQRGEGTLMLPFSKARRIRLGDEQGSSIDATVEVVGDRTLEGSVPRNLLCTGTTEFGNYRIEIRNLAQISLAQ